MRACASLLRVTSAGGVLRTVRHAGLAHLSSRQSGPVGSRSAVIPTRYEEPPVATLSSSSSGHGVVALMRRRPVAVYRVIDETALLGEQASHGPDALPPSAGRCVSLPAAPDNGMPVDGWPAPSVPRRGQTGQLRVFLGIGALALVTVEVLVVAPTGVRRSVAAEVRASAVAQRVPNQTQNPELREHHLRSRIRHPRNASSRQRVGLAAASETVVGGVARAISHAPSTADALHVADARPASPVQEFGFER